MNYLVTGGAGFIGSHFLIQMVKKYPNDFYICFDALTYAGNLHNLDEIKDYPNFRFVHGDITKVSEVEDVFRKFKIHYVVNFAAETHVDNSISGPDIFYKTNVLGTVNLLNAARKFGVVRFHQISTDEVYGDLPLDSKFSFTETSPLKPSSPYSSSKAAADLAVLAYARTYGLDVTISRSVNNFGKNQYKEKLIPKTLDLIAHNQPIIIYGDGLNVRSWIDVDKNNYYIDLIVRYSNPGEIYNIADDIELTNLQMVYGILEKLSLDDYPINFVTDRPGHDLKMSVNPKKVRDFVNQVEEGFI